VIDSGENTADFPWLALEDWVTTTVSLSPGRWIPLAATIDISRMKTQKKPEFLTIRLNLKDVPAGSIVYIDDVGLYPQQ
jgi:hypothetical protein